MKKALAGVKNLYKDESGDIVQTGVIMGILVLLAIAALTILKEPITNLFYRLTGEIDAIE